LGSIHAAGYAEAKDRTTSSGSNFTEVDSTAQWLSNEVEGKAGQKQSHPENSAPNKPVDNSEGSPKWQTVRMRVTAYCPCPKCCGQYSDGQTACGHNIRPGDTFVAADAKYPFGTEMIIAGYGDGESITVLDRGGAIRGPQMGCQAP
jgi:hypothetical protein